MIFLEGYTFMKLLRSFSQGGSYVKGACRHGVSRCNAKHRRLWERRHHFSLYTPANLYRNLSKSQHKIYTELTLLHSYHPAMSALSDRIREWEQINGAELYKVRSKTESRCSA